MKKIIIFVVRMITTAIFELIMYFTTTAQGSLWLMPQSRITVTSKTVIGCESITWADSATVLLEDSARLRIYGSIFGADRNSRFVTLEGSATLERMITDTGEYEYPVGYSPHHVGYRGLSIDVRSLATTGPALVGVRLIPAILGGISYGKYFPGNSSCVSNTFVAFNCLSPDGWHCDGPTDYEYVAKAYYSNQCGNSMRRLITTGSGTHAWQDSIENVVGDFPNSLCEYSDWTGNAQMVSGGIYRNFSDFAIASHVAVLPVTLVDLRADVMDRNTIRISWKTELEVNNDKFLVMKSLDGFSFSIVGEVSGSGTTTTPHEYWFDDTAVLHNNTYYYRLEQVDFDGLSHPSNIVSARITKTTDEVLEIRRYNLWGQEISEHTPGVQMVYTKTSSGVIPSKIFKPSP